MLFNSAIFLFFVAAVLGSFALLRGAGARKGLLLVASYLFYANWDWRYLPLLLGSTLLDYVAGARMAASTSLGRRRAWMLASLCGNLGVLALFKYGRFLLEGCGLSLLLGRLGIPAPDLPTEIPVGISFYTFQTLAYAIDVYRRQSEPCRSLLDFALFVAFFPQLVAGPIVRSTEFLPQLGTLRTPRLAEVSAGAQRFVLGLFKKVVLADNAGLFVDTVFAEPGVHGALTLWGAMCAFALQIWCDFSAYTDMALGAGRAFGFRFPENFDAPYLARSVTEFWRRWHMSLSRWLRDYLYIPLGGSRHGSARTHVNLLITMLLGGLWHGPAWSFVLWGGYMGLLLALERRLGIGRQAPARWRPRDLPRQLLTFHLVGLGWILFRGVDLDTITVYLARLGSAWTWTGEGETTALSWAGTLALLLVGQGLLRTRRLDVALWQRAPAALQGVALAALLLCCAALRVDQVAFLYFQF